MATASTRPTTSKAVAPSFPRLVIENVRPTVDGGRNPVKRVIGDEVEVEATVYKEGHDLIAARIRYCGPGEREARTAPMGYDRNLDRCRGSFQVDRIGRWWFTVEAWTDRFATWREDLEKKADAGQDTHSDLLEIANGQRRRWETSSIPSWSAISNRTTSPGRPSIPWR
jgi:starch synthase (maltosyl-transferring)